MCIPTTRNEYRYFSEFCTYFKCNMCIPTSRYYLLQLVTHNIYLVFLIYLNLIHTN